MERSLIEWLRARLPGREDLLVGPGDDAAVLRGAGDCDCVVTVDVVMDGVDFRLAEIDPRRAGRKALAVNLSDLAAMGAQPTAAVIGLVLPRQGGESLARELYEGLLPLAAEFDTVIAGGDVNSWAGPLVVSVTAMGQVLPGKAWRRCGARPGDAILVTGQFGGSILGKHLDFTPRVREALWLAERCDVHAAIDVSDGLGLDLARIATESDCGFVFEEASVPIAEAAWKLAAQELAAREHQPPDALEHALADGEDFELILAMPETEAERLLADAPLACGLTRIGTFTKERTLLRQRPTGELVDFIPRGYEHRLSE